MFARVEMQDYADWYSLPIYEGTNDRHWTAKTETRDSWMNHDALSLMDITVSQIQNPVTGTNKSF